MSAYDTKIQNALAKLSFGFTPATIAKLRLRGTSDTTIFGNDEFEPVRAYRYSGVAGQKHKCDLCGHDPIKNVFVIKSKVSGVEAHVGSECAVNYVDADIVAGMVKLFNLEYNKIVNPLKYEDAVADLTWAIDNRVSLPMTTRNEEGELVATYTLINGGSPRNVLRKITDGKPINKREREVLTAWHWVRENYAALETLEVINELITVYRNACREREQAEICWVRGWEYLGVLSAIEGAYEVASVYEKRQFDECRGEILRGSIRIPVYYWMHLIDIITYRAAKAAADAEAAAKVVEEPVKTEPTIPELFNAAFKKTPDNKFIKSLYAYYSRKGYLSTKQLSCLKRAA